mmetsp:Transcript_28384/g.58149  ORF Transcript_28384/g.58149 Transcript_28384/m.58149 type:complete len:84 (+) Transcript_28384:44-295(+)
MLDRKDERVNEEKEMVWMTVKGESAAEGRKVRDGYTGVGKKVTRVDLESYNRGVCTSGLGKFVGVKGQSAPKAFRRMDGRIIT